MPDPFHLIDEPISMVATVGVGIGDTLIRAEMPVQMSTLHLSALLGCLEAAPTSAALIWMRVVQRMYELWPEDL